MEQSSEHLFVIIGATGDLTGRKLLPSLYRVTTENGVGDDLHLLGVGRADMTDDAFRSWSAAALVDAGVETAAAAAWVQRVRYHASPAGTVSYDSLSDRITALEAEYGLAGNRAFYLALPPSAFADTITMLGGSGLATSPGWTRLVIEKPFGTDLKSAQSLNAIVHKHFDESQIYRIDHYLGKETVQNVLAFRFSNLLFEASWNRDRVERVEITVAESLGIEQRAGYYESAGVLRDMVQNHLTQLLTLVAMEAPNRFDAEAIRSEKVQALRAVSIDDGAVVFGQYAPGSVDGIDVVGYLEEDRVAAASTTPTFVAMRLSINNWRWEGVPFYLRTGKRLPRKTTQIVVTFKRPPVCLFHGVADACAVHHNVLIMTLQPNEGFELRFDVKAPGEPLHLVSEPLHFEYEDVFDAIPDAYQTLLHDVVVGDQTLFVRADEVEASWTLWDPVIASQETVESYPAGSWGPDNTNATLGRSGPEWVLSDAKIDEQSKNMNRS